VTVAKRIDGEFYLFDLSREGPLKMAGNEDEIKHWLTVFDYINVWSFEGKNLSSSKSEPLLKEWKRVMKGQPAEKRGGNKKKESSQRSLAKKGDRTDQERPSPGSRGRRKSTSSENRKKNRVSGDAFANPLGSNLSTKVIKEVKELRTKAANYKRKVSDVSIGEVTL